MDNSVRLHSQVSAEAKCSQEEASLACYLLTLSRSGKSLDEAAALLRRPRHYARAVARTWGIPFADYTADGPKAKLTWKKTERGKWSLFGDAGEVAVLQRQSGSYVAGFAMAGHEVTRSGSKPEVAMRRLVEDLDAAALDAFGVDDIEVLHDDEGLIERLFPVLPENCTQMRQALAA